MDEARRPVRLALFRFTNDNVGDETKRTALSAAHGALVLQLLCNLLRRGRRGFGCLRDALHGFQHLPLVLRRVPLVRAHLSSPLRTESYYADHLHEYGP